MKILDLLNPALEDVNESKESLETEIIVYAKINNFDGLEEASSKEEHEQLESEFKNGVRCRVRRTKDLKEVSDYSYEFTYKIKTSEEEGIEANREYTSAIDKDFYEGFKDIAEKRLLKTRYEFAASSIQLSYGDDEDKRIIEIPGVTYEIDVYQGSNGSICEWCKIDVEIDVILDHLAQHHPELNNIKLNVKLSHLPFEPSDAIISTSMTDEQKTFVDSLWSEHYNLPIKEDAT